jgi:hypothetical protein
MTLKFISKSYWYVVGFSVFASACGRSVSVPEGFGTLEAPQTEYSELAYPGPSIAKIDACQVMISSDHDFVLVKDAKAIHGVVRMMGQVESANEKQVVLQTDAGKVTLLYAIPGGLRLPVNAGGSMSVHVQPGILEHCNEYTVVDSVDGNLLHVSAKLNSDKPIHIRLSDDLEIYQMMKGEPPEISGHYSVGSIPVVLRLKGNVIPLSSKDKTEVTINGARYNAIVLNSMESRLAPGYESQSEGQGYWLEYVMVRQ